LKQKVKAEAEKRRCAGRVTLTVKDNGRLQLSPLPSAVLQFRKQSRLPDRQLALIFFFVARVPAQDLRMMRPAQACPVGRASR
jgi:hypothetical protein